MPAPLIMGAAAVAARLAAKKAASNVVKKAATKKAAAANARGLRAAQKPTNRTGSMADRMQRAELQGNSNLIKNASPARANRTRGGSLYAQKTYGGQGLVSKTLTPKQAARQAEITKELNPVRKNSVSSVTNKMTVSSPKSNVRVKPAARQIGNPPNVAKSISSKIDSVARAGGAGRGPAGKARDSRIGKSTKKK